MDYFEEHFYFLDELIDKQLAVEFHNQLNKHHNYLKRPFIELHEFQRKNSDYWLAFTRLLFQHNKHKEFLNWKKSNYVKAVEVNEYVCKRVIKLLGDDMA